MPTMAYGKCETYLIVCHSAVSPANEEWVNYLRFVSENISAILGTLVVTAGGSPNSSQRKSLANVVVPRKIPAAILTSSDIARGALIALGWLGLSEGKAFPAHAIEAAFDFLTVAPAKRRLMLAELARLEARLAKDVVTA